MKRNFHFLAYIALGCSLFAAPAVPQPTRATAGDLQIILSAQTNGIELASLTDLATQTLLATNTVPLFQISLRNQTNKVQRNLTSSEGWRQVSLKTTGKIVKLAWLTTDDPSLAGISIYATATLDVAQNAIHWSLRVDNRSKTWSIQRVLFPQLALADLGTNASVLFPRGPGEIKRGIWNRDFHYRGNYPDGWCCMQFMAAYREADHPTGLYLGLHDPWGSTKHLELKTSPTNHTIRATFDVPASYPNQPGNDFTLTGEAVWQLFRGDWFDAASIYRTWARREARWWPKLSRSGRIDSPTWMRELSAWVMTGGSPNEIVPRVKAFRDALGLPTGFHWYSWHQIPFDNDYPHYFPTKTNFAQAVAQLQDAGVYVMPYINGRLWDSKDKGADDFEFSKIALPASTKMEDGKPFLESYGSKETNGEPVRLAVMCPTTRLWQNKIQNIVLRLQRDEGTRAVYIDQIAAAPPTLCMDPSHGHPLGGGHWWNEGYWTLLKNLRRQMPPGRMITTECNGEPFINCFDGYLTWHWQHDGQVPAFPTVYGGAIQMFGRAYRGGPSKDLALRMKAAQQLVFGEQIGWFEPTISRETNNWDFLRNTIHTRWNFRRFFYAGEMARPPRLLGDIPKVTADWQWSGVWPVTTDALLAGAWRIPDENRLLLLFANVSDQSITTRFRFDPQTYGFNTGQWQRIISYDGQKPNSLLPSAIPMTEEISFPPKSVQAWEIALDHRKTK